MASRPSAGLLLFRRDPDGVRVLLGHMGGPFWARKDDAAWSVPKGELVDGEDAADAAAREFSEELGLPPPDGDWLPLGDVRSGSKVITVWAVEGDLEPTRIVPGTFTLEWPPRSGRQREFPEIDRVEWLDLETARVKLVASQRPLVDRLVEVLAGSGPG
ncbi:MAG TPA: NUDIX domain-containing protein [Actinomycetales bacterium]|nr:NUDIX domain-containing protein [Actinomycetales bacterium]